MPDATVVAGDYASPPSPREVSFWDRLKQKHREQLNTPTSLLNALRLVLAVCRLAWVPIAGSMVGGLLFVLPEQSQDVIRTTLGDFRWRGESFIHVLCFVGALVLWAVSAQIWARVITMHPRAACKLPRRCDDKKALRCVEAMPRLLGFSVFITMAMAIGCVVLETPSLVYALLAMTFLPLLLTLLIVLNLEEPEKKLLFRAMVAAAVIVFLFFLSYYAVSEEVEITTAVSFVAILAILLLTQLCLMLLPAKTGALKATVCFFLPAFLVATLAAQSAFYVEVENVCKKVSDVPEKCMDEVKEVAIETGGKALVAFEIAKLTKADVIDRKHSKIKFEWSEILPTAVDAGEMLSDRLAANWQYLIAVPMLLGLGAAWLAAVRNSLVDRWMGWSREHWLKAAKSRKEPAVNDASVPLASRPKTSRIRYYLLACAYVSVGVVAYIAFLLSPVTIGRWLGPAAVIALFVSLLIAPITLLSRWSLSWRFPMLTTVLAVLAVVGLYFDQHHVRELKNDAGTPVDPAAVVDRLTVSEALDAWKKDVGCESGCPPLFIVATAGGGIRAAYWTATVLAKLHDNSEGRFSKQLFAISGVSGGALGASVYRALLTRDERIKEAKRAGRPVPPVAPCDEKPLPLTSCAQAILSRDSLAPALGSMLFTDLVHRAVPLPAVSKWLTSSTWLRDRDRAAALEESWEESWRLALTPGTPDAQGNLLAGSFLNLWTDKSYPALLLNGTSVLSGRRIITSNLVLQPNGNQPFPDALDFFKAAKKEISVSTAANNSARFPVVGPAGTFEVFRDGRDGKSAVTSAGYEQVVDGGYFENFGATTALDLVEEIRTIDKELKVFFIQISSDPTLVAEGDVEDADGYPITELDASGNVGGDFVAPILALVATRTSRGTYQSDVVRNIFSHNNDNTDDEYVHLRMSTECGWGAPLGWTMSERVREHLSSRVCYDSNDSGLKLIRDHIKETADAAEHSAEQPAHPTEQSAVPEMVDVPTGDFLMGSPATDGDAEGNEKPQHGVTIDKRFAVSRYEITFDEWDECVADRGCNDYRPDDEGWGRGSRPVVNVSWKEARAYTRWLSDKTGEKYRLLTEAEFEYAARGGTTTRFSWGDGAGAGNANCKSCGNPNGGQSTEHVGSFKENAFGLFDMNGNVWEWVEDCWHPDYSGAPDNASAWETDTQCRRVLRGGSWSNSAAALRSAQRSGGAPDARANNVGFRIARTSALPGSE